MSHLLRGLNSSRLTNHIFLDRQYNWALQLGIGSLIIGLIISFVYKDQITPENLGAAGFELLFF
ncbi:MAG: hypothetical protein ACJAXB_000294 [Candidatus Endobugula sp.]|jgi:hypothetical protein